MKTKSFIAVLLMFVNASAFTQVPQNVEDSFKSKYPNATIKNFQHVAGNYVAKFVDKDEKHNATFNKNGKWVETMTQKKWDEIPSAVKVALKGSSYSGWYIQGCNQVATPHGILYSFDVTSPYTFTGSFKGDHYVNFTPSGKMLK